MPEQNQQVAIPEGDDSNDTKPQKQIRKAVVIGINDYKDPEFPKLFGAINDATEIQKRLRNFGEFEITKEHFLLNRNATSESIRKAISDILWEPDHCDLVLFYFSGHGVTDSFGNGYIAPYDMLSRQPLVNGINMDELKILVSRSVEKKCVLVILDCCFSGISTRGDKNLPDKVYPINSYFGDLTSEGEGRIIIASSGEDEKSREIELVAENGKDMVTHGVFTHYLIEGLDSKAMNDNGTINLDRLYKYVEKRLIDKGQKPQFSVSSGSQLENIRIARVPEIQYNFFKSHFDVVKEKLSDNNALSLFDAVDVMKIILENSDSNLEEKIEREILNLRNEIQKSLSDYRVAAGLWLENNTEKLAKDYRTAYYALEQLPPCLAKFETIFGLNDRGKKQLVKLCRVSKREMKEETFFESCQLWNESYHSV